MRAALLFAAGAVLGQATSVVPVESTLTVTECGPSSTWARNSSSWTNPLPTSPNATVTTDIIVPPSETSGDAAIPTAGATSQPLQSSMVGLLGFVIVGLILV